MGLRSLKEVLWKCSCPCSKKLMHASLNLLHTETLFQNKWQHDSGKAFKKMLKNKEFPVEDNEEDPWWWAGTSQGEG